MQCYQKMIYELYCKPEDEIIMGIFTEKSISVEFDVQPKVKE